MLHPETVSPFGEARQVEDALPEEAEVGEDEDWATCNRCDGTVKRDAKDAKYWYCFACKRQLDDREVKIKGVRAERKGRTCDVCGFNFQSKLEAMSGVQEELRVMSDHLTTHNPSPAQWGAAAQKIAQSKPKVKKEPF